MKTMICLALLLLLPPLVFAQSDTSIVAGQALAEFKSPFSQVEVVDGVVVTENSEFNDFCAKWQISGLVPLFPWTSPPEGTYLCQFPEESDVRDFCSELMQISEVIVAEPNYIGRPSADPTDTLFSSQWAMQKIQALKAWDINRGNSNIVIGVVDSGIDTLHPDLYGNLWTDPTTGRHGRNFAPPDTCPSCPVDTNDIGDRDGHCTGIAGLAAAVTNNVTGISGLAGGWYPQRGASIMAVRIMDEFGRFGSDRAVSGLRWAADHGANVINCSWYIGIPSGPDTFAILRTTVNHAISWGAVVVASAGNVWPPASPDSVGILPVPARWPEVIAVASTDSFDQKATSGFYTANYDVDIAAPGVDVLTTYLWGHAGGYMVRGGTSFAAAYVSGLLALVKSVAPTLANPQNAIFKTAEKVGGYEYVDLDSIGSRSRKLGYGRINAYKTLSMANGAPATPQSFGWSGQPGQHPTFAWSPNTEPDLAGYNIYKDNVKLNTFLLTTTTYIDSTEVVPEYGGGVEHIYNLNAVDVADNQSPSARVLYEEGKGVEKNASGEDARALPTTVMLEQGYPNPFNPSSVIRYALPHTSFVTLTAYNTLGQQVAQLVNEQQQAGYHDVVFRGDGLASGVYFYRLQTGGFVANRKILLLK
jgi:thermitase